MSKKKPQKLWVMFSSSNRMLETFRDYAEAVKASRPGDTISAYELVEPRKAKS